MNNMLTAAKAAKMEISQLTTTQKNNALNAMADALLAQQDHILAANEADMAQASSSISSVISTSASCMSPVAMLLTGFTIAEININVESLRGKIKLVDNHIIARNCNNQNKIVNGEEDKIKKFQMNILNTKI